MARLLQADRKVTATQVTTRCIQGTQNMGYSSSRPHRVPLLSAKTRRLGLQFTRHLDGMLRFFFVSLVQVSV